MNNLPFANLSTQDFVCMNLVKSVCNFAGHKTKCVKVEFVNGTTPYLIINNSKAFLIN